MSTAPSFWRNAKGDEAGGKNILIAREATFKKKIDLHKVKKYPGSTVDITIPDNATKVALESGKVSKKYKITHWPLYIHHRDSKRNRRDTSPTVWKSHKGWYEFNNNAIVATVLPQTSDNIPLAVEKPTSGVTRIGQKGEYNLHLLKLKKPIAGWTKKTDDPDWS